MSKILWVMTFCLLSFSVSANRDISNATDYPLIERFPDSYIVQFNQRENADYRLIMGGLEKINGVLAPEKEERLKGDLTRITYRIPENHSPQEAYNFIRDQFLAAGAEQQYSCIGRACGSSNQWANQIFRYSRLYGVDRTQLFSSYRLGESAYMLYAVQRGNKRVYLRLEALDTDPATETISGSEVGDSKSDTVLVLSESRDEVAQIREMMEQYAGEKLWVVTYDFNPGTHQERLERAQAHAEKLSQSFSDPDQITFYAAGGFNFPGQTNEGVKVIVFKNSMTEAE